MWNVPGDDRVLVPGFHAAGISAGIKMDGRRDLALIYSLSPAVVAGMFTQNSFPAAPVKVSAARVKGGVAQAIIANSGNANACTGPQGIADAEMMTRVTAEELGLVEELVLVSSTGVIGHPLPITKILDRVGALVAELSPEGIPRAEEAIMTTDKWPKIAFRRATIGGKDVTFCGIAKGAGMIQPQMATMLAYIMTDLQVDRETLDGALRYAVNRTFNAISVDGCMSTNDTVIALANGWAHNVPCGRRSRDYQRLVDTLMSLTEELAKSMVRDGEGATKVIEVVVEEAISVREAKRVAYAVGTANLVKAAFFGQDPNWGRIISAVGSLGLPLEEEKVRLDMGDTCLFAGGIGVARDEETLRETMRAPEIRVTIKLGRGTKSWRIWASDLSFDYVRINSHYRT